MRTHSYYKSLFIVYSCLVLTIGVYFLMMDKLTPRAATGDLPLDFLLRFVTFWFASFVLALLFFALHIYLNKYYHAQAEIVRSIKLGKLAFTLGVGAIVVAVLLYISLA